MNKDLTLVVMAAGMGSRFGGLKQIEPFGPNNEFIIDYSVYDAILSGFNKVIFIIKEENLEIFKETIGKRIESKIDVEYAFQTDTITYKDRSFKRIKPWGTAHAIWMTKDMIDGNFLVINSDDFYGRDCFKKASEFLKSNEENNLGIICYDVVNTLTENGAVKRGVCKIVDDKVIDIIESSITKEEGKIVASPLNGNPSFEISPKTKVSMNALLFTKKIFNLIDKYFDEFMDSIEQDPEKVEYLIPDVIKKGIEDNIINVKNVSTSAKWEGVTYKEDKDTVVKALNKLIEQGEYNSNLWQDF